MNRLMLAVCLAGLLMLAGMVAPSIRYERIEGWGDPVELARWCMENGYNASILQRNGVIVSARCEAGGE